MEELGQFLSRTPATINSGGRWVVLSYHSREDRLVKHAFQEGERAGTLRVLTKHVIQPSEQEMMGNPRSRSAKLRCAERMPAAARPARHRYDEAEKLHGDDRVSYRKEDRQF